MTKSITLEEFETHKPEREPCEWIVEKAWFINPERDRLGMLEEDAFMKDWSFVLFERNDKGTFYVFYCEVSMPRKQAESRLHRLMIETFAEKVL